MKQSRLYLTLILLVLGVTFTGAAAGSSIIVSSSCPGGLTTQILFNNAGACAGNANLTWDNSASTLKHGQLGLDPTAPSQRFYTSDPTYSFNDCFSTSTFFAGTPDPYHFWGWNVKCGGTNQDVTGDATFWDSLETNYRPDAGTFLFERYYEYQNAARTVTRRPFYTSVDKTSNVVQSWHEGLIEYFNSAHSLRYIYWDGAGIVSLENGTFITAANNAKLLKATQSGGGAPVDILYLDSANKAHMSQPVLMDQTLEVTGAMSFANNLSLGGASGNGITNVGNITPFSDAHFNSGSGAMNWSSVGTRNVQSNADLLLRSTGGSTMRFYGGAGGTTEFMRLFATGGFSIGNTTDPGVGELIVNGLKTTGAAAGKTAVCVDTSTGKVYASTTAGGCT